MSEIKANEIESLLEIFEASNWDEMRLKVDGLEMFVSKTPGARPAADEITTPRLADGAHGLSHAPAAPTPGRPRSAEGRPQRAAPEHWVTVRAPNLGTFYRAPKPGAPPYVTVGQRVDPSTELCLIEVMKLFTSVVSGVSGIVRELLVEDAELVEFDQALFLIEPDA